MSMSFIDIGNWMLLQILSGNNCEAPVGMIGAFFMAIGWVFSREWGVF